MAQIHLDSTIPNGIPKARVEMPQPGKYKITSRTGHQTVIRELEVSHTGDSNRPGGNAQGSSVSRAQSLIFYVLPSFSLRLFYSICTQGPSIIPFYTLFKPLFHSYLFCIPHHYKVGNSAKIPISVLFDCILVFCLLRWAISS